MSDFDDDLEAPEPGPVSDDAGLSVPEAGPAPEPEIETDLSPMSDSRAQVETKRRRSSTGAVKVRTPRGERPDWEMVRRLYVEGERRHDPAFGSYTHYPTLAEVARVTGWSHADVNLHAREDDWTLARADWQAQTEAKRQDLRAREIAKHTLRMDASAVKSASIGLALILKRVEQIAEQQDAQEKKAAAIAAGQYAAAMDDDGFDAGIDGRELETLARAAGAWHTLGRKVLGVEEVTRIEFSGGVEVRTPVNQELVRDDPDRLFGFLVAAERSGLLDDNILDGEIVEDSYETVEPGTEFIPPADMSLRPTT